ncbi:carbohydrate ABC transporter permease [Paenibacillus ehimensis]|uniref:Sugar ABC transporter permease n=1 Tax=Paenibacillus ehimensis TaxID=79264 RepID=A0ABT8V9H0_9BACL|nr:sugar ABC transporter permease [Paenibacillus ehimensis]MDO3677599.1 sugar ABC transporter permease [Paenibacillus ehimensis]MEC0208878.1 sugar ABC transporter permease [Paenibacillus ehimensis]
MLALFVYMPLIQNLVYSFQEFSMLSGKRSFIGLDNYKTLFSDPVIVTALINNVKYAVISVIFQVGFGLILAAVLEDEAFRKISPLFRTIYFIPVVISITVICLLFTFVYHPTDGLLNLFLEAIGLGSWAKPWLGSGSTAIYAVIAVSQWQSVGYCMMLFIVAIQKIPADLYEAAKIDGAGKIRSFFNVTLPQVKEMCFVTSVITITGAFMVFNEPFIMTKGGGPGTSSITVAVHMYQTGFFKDSMGYASTIAMLMFLITAVLAFAQTLFFRTGKGD